MNIKAAWEKVPVFIQKFITDALEGSIIIVLALNLVLPHNLEEAKAQGLLIIAGIGAPILAAFRRNVIPAVIAWYLSTFKGADNPSNDGVPGA